MSDPYEVLGLPPDAAEAEIRARYLQLVREFPPDRSPQRFAQIRAAYDELRDPLKSLERSLFRLSSRESIAGISEDLRSRLRNSRLSMNELLSITDVS